MLWKKVNGTDLDDMLEEAGLISSDLCKVLKIDEYSKFKESIQKGSFEKKKHVNFGCLVWTTFG